MGQQISDVGSIMESELGSAYWVLLTAFYKYPVEMRKTIYTTNAIEGLNAQLRKNTSNRKVFPNHEAVTKILFLNIEPKNGSCGPENGASD